MRKGNKVEEGCRSGWRKISKWHHLRNHWGKREFFTWRRAEMRVFERLSCGAGGSTFGLSLEIKRLGWVRKRKTGRPCYRKWRSWACACYWKLGVLLGGTPGSSSKSKNSWESKLEKIVGVLVLRWYISQPKSTYFEDFITSGMVRGRESAGIYKELPGRTQVGDFTSTFLSAEALRHCYRHTIGTSSDRGQDRLLAEHRLSHPFYNHIVLLSSQSDSSFVFFGLLHPAMGKLTLWHIHRYTAM